VTVAARRLTDRPPAAADRAAELDAATLRRAQAGDRAATQALVERYQGQVFALIGRLVGAARAAQVEDLAQDTFLAVFRTLSGFDPRGPARLSTWILAIATRRAIDELRRPRLVGARHGDDAAVVASPRRGDDGARRAEIAAAIERAVGALAPEYRATFLLHEYHGLGYGEIAVALGVDLGTVKSRLSRARAALRAALAEVHGA
jgi:RNA polymerase sigma-70 factor, ECF subfamily